MGDEKSLGIKIVLFMTCISIISPFIVLFITKKNQSSFSHFIIKKKNFFIQVFEQQKPFKDFIRLLVFIGNPKIITQNSLHIGALSNKGICSLPRGLFIDGKDWTQFFAKKFFDKNIKAFIIKNEKVFPIRNIDNFYFRKINKNTLLQSALWKNFIEKPLHKLL